MKLAPVRDEGPSSYPRWGTAVARSLRRVAISSAGVALIGALGCAPPPPGVMVPVSEPVEASASEVPLEGPVDPARAEPGPGERDEWVWMPIRVIFQQSRAELDDEDRAMLRELLAALAHRRDVIRIRVVGHAIEEWESTNGLAMARARACSRFLVVEGGLPEELLEVVEGDGGYSTAGAIDRTQWQRVEFSILLRRQDEP